MSICISSTCLLLPAHVSFCAVLLMYTRLGNQRLVNPGTSSIQRGPHGWAVKIVIKIHEENGMATVAVDSSSEGTYMRTPRLHTSISKAIHHLPRAGRAGGEPLMAEACQPKRGVPPNNHITKAVGAKNSQCEKFAIFFQLACIINEEDPRFCDMPIVVLVFIQTHTRTRFILYGNLTEKRCLGW